MGARQAIPGRLYLGVVKGKRAMKRILGWLVAIVLVVVALGATVGRPWLSEQPWMDWVPWPDEEPAGEVRQTTVQRGDLLVTVSATGNIEPRARVALSFDLAGRVTEVVVEVGDKVKAGDPLARLDDRALLLQVEQAKASLEGAEAQLALVMEGARPEQIAAAEANVRAVQAQAAAAAANLEGLEGGATYSQIAAAQAQVAAAELGYQVALIAHDTLMRGDRAGGAREKEQARDDLYVAETALTAARAGYYAVAAGADDDLIRAAEAAITSTLAQADAAQAQLELLQAGASEEQIASAEAQVAQAEVAVEAAELVLDRAVLVAPFDGVIAASNLSVDGLVSPGVPVMLLLDTSTLRLRIGVDEMDVRLLEEGQNAEVTLDALPGIEIKGTVEQIATEATLESGVVIYDVLVALEPASVPLRTDMTANATVVVAELSEVLTIPTWVVRTDRDTGQTFVLRQRGEELERADVRLGVRANGTVQVLEGVEEGDTLALVEEEMVDLFMENLGP
jgi:RND family efflux transporter MFP subunit